MFYTDIRFKHRNDKSTVAYVDLEGVTGKGIARLQPGDHYSMTIGEEIALGRALIDLGIKYQNKWILRSRTEEEVRAQRANKNRINVSLNVNTSPMQEALDNIFKDVNNVANRPVKTKARKSSKSHTKKNLPYGE